MPNSPVPAAAIGLPAAIESDAELLLLREPLLAAWREEIETYRNQAARSPAELQSDKADLVTDAARDRTSAIVDRILEFSPTSLAGLGVQALALSWTRSGEQISAELIDKQCTTDLQLLSSIVTALINIEGGVDGSFLSAPALHPDGQLLTLEARLREVDAAKQNHSTADNEAYETAYKEHWRLRAEINETGATTIDGLRVKARAANLAFRDDDEAACKGPGSFIELSRSINRDLQSERLNAHSELKY
jgi:hypothetical protein